jgi:hypothetical protein
LEGIEQITVDLANGCVGIT